MLRWTPSPPRASATRPGAARVFLHCPALSFVTDGMPFSSICARFASVCCAFFCAPCSSHPICPSPRQVIREKYERLLSAAPTATLDCSSLFDGKRAIEVIERAVSKHAGRNLVEPSHQVCHLYTLAVCVLNCCRVSRVAYSKLIPLCSRH